MQRIFLIIFLSLLTISCKKQTKNQEINQIKEKGKVNKIQDSASDTLSLIEKNPYLEENIFIGKFFSNSKIDTLNIRIYSAKEDIYLDSIPENKIQNQENKNEYIFNNEIELHIKGKSNIPLKLQPAASLFFIKNIGDNNEDGLDEIALVVNYADDSNLNSCKIYQFCNSQWQELFSFSINEMNFYFENEKESLKYKNSIKDHFEKRNYIWYFSDYMESMNSDNGNPIFKKLKLKKCK